MIVLARARVVYAPDTDALLSSEASVYVYERACARACVCVCVCVSRPNTEENVLRSFDVIKNRFLLLRRRLSRGVLYLVLP